MCYVSIKRVAGREQCVEELTSRLAFAAFVLV